MRLAQSTWKSMAGPTGRSAARGNSLIEMLTVCAIIIFLLALLVPSLGQAREQARRIQCANNLVQWGRAAGFYRTDYNDYLPTEGTYLHPDKPYTWFNVLPPYLSAPAYREVEGVGLDIKDFPELHVWICPSKNVSRLYKSGSGKNQFHYGMNQVLDGVGSAPNGSTHAPGFPDQGELPIHAKRFDKRPNTVFLFDIYPNESHGWQVDVGTSFHRNYANVLYLDGRVANFKAADFVRDGKFQLSNMIWNNPELDWGYRPPQAPDSR